MASNDERLKILDLVEKGLISAEDAIKLLEAIGDNEAEVLEAGESVDPQDWVKSPEPLETNSEVDSEAVDMGDEAFYRASEDEPNVFEAEPEVITPAEPFDPSQLKWRSFWWIPMWIGVGVTVIGSMFMYWAWNTNGFGFWFACAWFPFTLGVVLMALAWASRTARWLHVRVHQKPGQKPERIAISLPIPLRLTAWFLRVFGKKIPNMGNTSLDEVIMALDATSPEAPFYVEVNEGDDGERVEGYLG